MSRRMLVIDSESGMTYSMIWELEGSRPTEDVISKIQEERSVDPTFLPHDEKGCAAFAQKGPRRLYLMYLSPNVPRKILFNPENNAPVEEYSLYLPHTYIALALRGGAIEGGYALVAKKKLTSLDDPIGRLPFPNVDQPRGKICEGNEAMFSVTQGTEVTTEAYVRHFLDSNFTSHMGSHHAILPVDLQVNPAPGHRTGLSSSVRQSMVFVKWEEFSRKGSQAIVGLDWKTDFTVKSFVEQLRGM